MPLYERISITGKLVVPKAEDKLFCMWSDDIMGKSISLVPGFVICQWWGNPGSENRSSYTNTKDRCIDKMVSSTEALLDAMLLLVWIRFLTGPENLFLPFIRSWEKINGFLLVSSIYFCSERRKLTGCHIFKVWKESSDSQILTVLENTVGSPFSKVYFVVLCTNR